MRILWAFIKKESRHILRDYRTIMVLFLMPVAQILIFGFVVTTEVQNACIGIWDQAKDNASLQLVQKLESSGYFRVERYFRNRQEIDAAFSGGDIALAMVIEPDFGSKLMQTGGTSIQLLADASDANTAQILVNYSTAVIRDFEQEQSRLSPREMPPQVTVRMLYNPYLKGVYMTIPGTMAMVLILISAMMTSISITREKEKGSMEVLLISPLQPYQIILGKVAPYVVLSMINAITIVAMGVFVFNMPVVGSWFWLFVINLLYILLSLALGIFISTLARNQMVAMFASIFGLLLPTILLSGFIFPIENMPVVLQTLSRLIPPRYYVQAVKTVMIQGGGLAYMWQEMLVMSGFLTLFLALSIWKFKVRLEA
ncbi:MAG: ABC transporter permease [Spirochaetales bacterium]|jgi:ABC-2 type transport system permease protein|nr:ABC transporter permease [Spirochaetales bacterium]